MEVKVFTYWEVPSWYTKRFDYIDMCLETIDRHSDELLILDERTAKDLYPSYYKFSCIAQKSDYIRLNYLRQNGGIWIDADTIIIKTLSILGEILENNECFWHSKKRGSLNGVMGFRNNSELCTEMFFNCEKDIKSGKPQFRTKFGPYILDSYHNKVSDLFNIPKDWFYYIPLYNSYKLCEEGELIFPDHCLGFSVFNKRLTEKRKWFYKMTKRDHMKSNSVFSNLYKESMN